MAFNVKTTTTTTTTTKPLLVSGQLLSTYDISYPSIVVFGFAYSAVKYICTQSRHSDEPTSSRYALTQRAGLEGLL